MLCGGCASERGSTSDGGASEGPLYAISTSVLSDDGATSYVAVVGSLGGDERVALDGALELSGGARAYGPARDGVVYATSDESGTLTEITFDDDGVPVKGREVSFANLGITGTTGGNVHYFVAPDKAYFVSQDTYEIVVWNPEEMAIIETVPLDLAPHLASEGGYFYFYPRPLIVGDRLILIANQSGPTDIDGPVVISVVDTERDRVIETTVEPRCHGLLQSAVDGQGDRYFASSDYTAAVHFMRPDEAPAPCMLRMLAGETAFDRSWSRTLSDDLATPLWTGVTPGARGTMYVQSIVEDAPSVLAAEEPYEIAVAQPWTWRALEDGDADPRALDADFLVSPPLFPAIEVDGKPYVSLWDETDTTLVDLSGDEPQRTLTVPGFVFNIVRIR